MEMRGTIGETRMENNCVLIGGGLGPGQAWMKMVLTMMARMDRAWVSK
jgi:hypothetical protein